MKSLGSIVTILAIWLAGISVYLVVHARQGVTDSAATKLGGDEAARLRSRLDTAERRITALQSELRASSGSAIGASMAGPSDQGVSSQDASAVAAAPAASSTPSATFTVNGTTITVTGNLPGLLGQSVPFDPAVVADFDSNSFFSGQGPASYPDLAKAGVQVMLTAREYPDYLGNHGAMDAMLQNVANMSNGLIKDDGSNPQASAQNHQAYSAAIDSAISRAKLIAARTNESPTAVQQTQQIQQMLEVMKSRQSP